jgi:Ni/Co efflux regulator RcnB
MTNIIKAVRRTRAARRRIRCRIPAVRLLVPSRMVRRLVRWGIRRGRRLGPPGGGARFSYRGHDIERVHIHPFIYPPGFGYRRWEVGAALPPLFLARDYWYADWAALGMDPPPPGYQWVRYGPDLLLVNVITGQVADVAYDVFYD